MLKSIHVVPQKDNGWDIKEGGKDKPLSHADTKAEAETQARDIAKKQKAELFIHRKDGTIERRDSYGNDPRGSKG